ncbi:MAG: thermonuclease family protein [Planctomycetota bacterium]
MSRAAGLGLRLALLLALGGCSTGERLGTLEHRAAELRVAVEALEARLDAQGGLEERLRALEQASGKPAQPATQPAPLARGADDPAALAARVEQLALRVAALEARRRAATQAEPAGPEAIPVPREQAPAPGAALEPVSLGSGELVLARIAGQLERLRLAGIEAPRRREEYEADPVLAQRHEAAFGRKLGDDEPWRRARDRLGALLEGAAPRLRYPPGGPRRTTERGLLVVLEGKDGQDLNAALVAEGLALAADETYLAQERAARAAHRGLFAAD